MRKLMFCLTAGLLCVVGLLLALVTPARCPVTAAFARIEEGMTAAEVEAILGGPPGDYRTIPPPRTSFSLGVSLGGYSMVIEKDWQGNEGDVLVGFDDTGHVVRKDFSPRDASPVGPVEMIRWRIERLVGH